MIKILNHHTVDGFKWVKKLSKVNERFIKNYNEKSDQRYFLEVNVEIKVDVSKKKYSTELHSIFIAIYHFCLKEIKFKNVISLFATYMTKKTMLCI